MKPIFHVLHRLRTIHNVPQPVGRKKDEFILVIRERYLRDLHLPGNGRLGEAVSHGPAEAEVSHPVHLAVVVPFDFFLPWRGSFFSPSRRWVCDLL